jgi:hypothetical protein
LLGLDRQAQVALLISGEASYGSTPPALFRITFLCK